MSRPAGRPLELSGPETAAVPSILIGFAGGTPYKRGDSQWRLALGYAYPSSAFADPGGSGAIVAAVSWLQNTLLGTVATTVAVICVATVGLMMLSGRVDLRRGASVVLGCFILFGASTIAAGISSVATGDFGPAEATAQVEPWLPPPPPQPPPAPPRVPSDPFAGAAVPTR